jgi:polyprenyl P-hydroxybenzoate/phenylacrylic acid decarboxylase-like protein
MAVEKRILVGASGASGMPLLMKCLEILRDSEEYRSLLVMSRSAKLTLEQETDWSVSQVEALADEVLEQDNIGAGPASGSYRTEGMVIVPCSMKTAAGIVSGYTDNLLLRAADVTIKEKRPRFVPAFELMTFRDNTISVSVPTTELREEILRSKTGMLMRIAELAGIEGMIELEVTVNEEIRAARPIKLEDRVRYITEKNPLVAELRKALDLEVE